MVCAGEELEVRNPFDCRAKELLELSGSLIMELKMTSLIRGKSVSQKV